MSSHSGVHVRWTVLAAAAALLLGTGAAATYVWLRAPALTPSTAGEHAVVAGGPPPGPGVTAAPVPVPADPRRCPTSSCP